MGYIRGETFEKRVVRSCHRSPSPMACNLLVRGAIQRGRMIDVKGPIMLIRGSAGSS